jgi:hypothetical protein
LSRRMLAKSGERGPPWGTPRRGLEGRPLYIYICHPKRGMARSDEGFVSKDSQI